MSRGLDDDRGDPRADAWSRAPSREPDARDPDHRSWSLPDGRFSLPSGVDRQSVWGRDRGYRLRDTESHTLETIGTFHVVFDRDLREGRYRGDLDRLEDELKGLTGQGLVESRTLNSGHRGHSMRTVTAQLGSPGASGFEAVTRLDLKPGRYHVRIGAASDRGTTGSVYHDLDVPDFSSPSLALSGVAVHVSPTLPAATFGLGGLLLQAPTCTRVFTHAQKIQGLVQVYQQRGQPVQVDLRMAVVDNSDRVVVERDVHLPGEAFQADGSSEWRFTLPVEELESGDYLVRVTASDARHNRVPPRIVRLSVR